MGFLHNQVLLIAQYNQEKVVIIIRGSTKVPWASDSTNFMTYAKGGNLSDEEIKDLDVNLIVLDEFHRCGAEVWGAGVQRILNAHAESYVFGTTATPIRYLDANRDMSDELFDGVLAEDLSLTEAILRKILQAPKYVATLYTVEEEIDEMMETLGKSKKSREEKKEIAVEINQIKLNWEKTSGVPQILKKHLKPETNKFIIFCKDQEHLDQMEVEVQRWFQKAGTHRWRKVYRFLSADLESDRNLEAFKVSKSKDTAHLLFTIDMLNEGLHISDVGAVILLRPTESPRIFYQQIGRCIEVNVEDTPIIFDLVNNFQNIRADDFLEDLEEAREAERKRRADSGLEEYATEIHIIDETKEILEVCENISERLEPWEVMFQHLFEYSMHVGNTSVPINYITENNYKLGVWVFNQRQAFRRGKLSEKCRKTLEQLSGWVWDPRDASWREGFNHLCEYAEREKHTSVSVRYITENGYRLGAWVREQRSNYQQKKIPIERAKALEHLTGWTWDQRKTAWFEGFKRLKEYTKREKHSRVIRGYVTNDGYNLGNWVQTQRQLFRKRKLSREQIEALENIPGWAWEPDDSSWDDSFNQLLEFVEREGHALVPTGYITEDNSKFKTPDLWQITY